MKYTVKRGDTLSKIARAHGTTLSTLLNANPRFRARPDRINVGDILEIPAHRAGPPGTGPVLRGTAGTSGAPAKAVRGADSLGKLSAKYETGNRGPGTVSTVSRNSPAVQRGVARRFTNEETDALAMLEAVA